MPVPVRPLLRPRVRVHYAGDCSLKAELKTSYQLLTVRILLLLAPLFAGCLLPAAPLDAVPSDLTGQPVTTEYVLARMAEQELVTTPALRNYVATRHYVLENKRFNKRAEMVVRMTYNFPGQKSFEVLSESGSGLLRKRIFRRMLDSELEASSASIREATQITPQNYNFRLVGTEEAQGRKRFVLEALPKTRNKFLFEGRVWVDAQDFAIVRIQGKPATNPSFLIRGTTFVHHYGKHGPFWLAASNRSATDSFVFGRTEISIHYFDYQLNRSPEAKSPRTPKAK